MSSVYLIDSTLIEYQEHCEESVLALSKEVNKGLIDTKWARSRSPKSTRQAKTVNSDNFELSDRNEIGLWHHPIGKIRVSKPVEPIVRDCNILVQIQPICEGLNSMVTPSTLKI